MIALEEYKQELKLKSPKELRFLLGVNEASTEANLKSVERYRDTDIERAKSCYLLLDVLEIKDHAIENELLKFDV